MLNPIERLERRRLLDGDLVPVGVGGGFPTLLFPGRSFGITVTIQNAGPDLVDSPFKIGCRLVRSTLGNASPLAFTDPSAVKLFEADYTYSGFIGIAPGNTATRAFKAIIPANIPAGTYTALVKVDPTNTAAEPNENNNVFATQDVQVLSSAGTMVVNLDDTANNVTMTGPITQTPPNPKIAQLTTPARVFSLALSDVLSFDIQLGGGNDVFTMISSKTALPPLVVQGGDGNDKITGGSGADTLAGNAGKDQIDGGEGNDRLNGNGGNDKLFGNTGADRLYGYDGNDFLDGGSSGDRLDGGQGIDTAYGQGGNDRFFAADTGTSDQLFGGSGEDSATADTADVLSSIELKDLI